MKLKSKEIGLLRPNQNLKLQIKRLRNKTPQDLIKSTKIFSYKHSKVGSNTPRLRALHNSKDSYFSPDKCSKILDRKTV